MALKLLEAFASRLKRQGYEMLDFDREELWLTAVRHEEKRIYDAEAYAEAVTNIMTGDKAYVMYVRFKTSSPRLESERVYVMTADGRLIELPTR